MGAGCVGVDYIMGQGVGVWIGEVCTVKYVQ